MAHQEERGERPAPREGEALEREPSARGGERDGDDGPPPDDVAEPRPHEVGEEHPKRIRGR